MITLAIRCKLNPKKLVMSIVNIRILIATMGRSPKYVERLSRLTLIELTFSPFRCCVVLKGTNLAFGFPANACPPALVANVCSSPIAPITNHLDTTCPFSNNNFINVPLRSQPANSAYVQCHYSSSECYYDVCFIHSDDRAYL